LQHVAEHFNSHEFIKIPESSATEGAAGENSVDRLAHDFTNWLCTL